MVDVRNVTKTYGAVKALSDVSFSIDAGTIVGLLGPNGAGKSTLMKVLTGYLQPDAGRVSIDDFDVLTQRRQAQQRIGYLPENAPLYPELTVQEYLLMMADVRCIPGVEQRAAIKAAVNATGLEPVITRPIQQLSKGYRQRVGIAQAILHRPKLLILDEPTVGLDPTQLAEVRQLIRTLAKSSTVLFSSHILPEVEALCDRAVMIMGGVIRADARLSELAKSGSARLILDGSADAKTVADALSALPGAGSVRREEAAGGRLAFVVRGPDGGDLCPDIFELAKRENWPLRELRSETRTLETVFNELARGAAPAPVPTPSAAPSPTPPQA
ncbi:MAG: ATP-binding cassette domain-containing protein [Deinococcales bacterium]